jgi:hypothetical protein
LPTTSFEPSISGQRLPETKEAPVKPEPPIVPTQPGCGRAFFMQVLSRYGLIQAWQDLLCSASGDMRSALKAEIIWLTILLCQIPQD